MSSFTPDTPRPEAVLRARGLSFRAQLILGVCGLVLLTGAAITWLAHLSARQSTDTLADALFREASAHAVTETRAFAERATPVVETLRRLANDGLGGRCLSATPTARSHLASMRRPMYCAVSTLVTEHFRTSFSLPPSWG